MLLFIHCVAVCCHSVHVAEVQAIASMIEKQAQIVVKHKEVSEESKKRKEALLAQYANITDEDEYPWIYSCTHENAWMTSFTAVVSVDHADGPAGDIFMWKTNNVCFLSSSECFPTNTLFFNDHRGLSLSLDKKHWSWRRGASKWQYLHWKWQLYPFEDYSVRFTAVRLVHIV